MLIGTAPSICDNDEVNMYTYFLLTDTGLDFLVDAVSVPDAIEYIENILRADVEDRKAFCADAMKSRVVCVRPYHEVESYFSAVQ